MGGSLGGRQWQGRLFRCLIQTILSLVEIFSCWILLPVFPRSKCYLGTYSAFYPLSSPPFFRFQVSFQSMQTPAVLTFLHMLSAAGGLSFASQVCSHLHERTDHFGARSLVPITSPSI